MYRSQTRASCECWRIAFLQQGFLRYKKRREDHLRGQAPPVRYDDVWQWVLRTYGQDLRSSTLQELRLLEPQTQGKLTAEAWLAYSKEFLLRLARMEDAREEEVADWPLARVPDHTRTALLRQEAKSNKRHPVVRLTGTSGMSTEGIQLMLAQILVDQQTIMDTRILSQTNGYQIHLPGGMALDRVLSASGRPHEGGVTPSSPRLTKKCRSTSGSIMC